MRRLCWPAVTSAPEVLPTRLVGAAGAGTGVAPKPPVAPPTPEPCLRPVTHRLQRANMPLITRRRSTRRPPRSLPRNLLVSLGRSPWQPLYNKVAIR